MNFAIEVPAEANPLSSENLYRALNSAASNDRQQIQTGAQQLSNWEKQKGYYSLLYALLCDLSLPLEIRYISAIQLKNGLDKYWRKSAINGIEQWEKSLIRSECLEGAIREPDRRIVLQHALIVAKIVRIDFPQQWSNAIVSIADALRKTSQLTRTSADLSKTLLITLHTVKELSAGRLVQNRANLQHVAPILFQCLYSIYVSKSVDGIPSLGCSEEGLLALRTLRRLAIDGFDFPNRYDEVENFWKITYELLARLYIIVKESISQGFVHVRLLNHKDFIQVAKFHLSMVQNHPAAFALLPEALTLAHGYWSIIAEFGPIFGSQTPGPFAQIGRDGDADDESAPFLEKISLKGLLLLRGCVKMVFNPAQSFKYRHAKEKEEKSRATILIKDALLTEDFVKQMMEVLVTKYFTFRLRDLRDWEEEPEEWERREEGEGDVWEFSLRSCAEKLFLDLMINFKEFLIPRLLEIFHTFDIRSTDVLMKDSIYGAIGLAAPVLESNLDFEAFLETTLVPEVQVEKAGYHILRRRIAIILGQWLPVKEGLNRLLVYQIFQHLLDKDHPLNDQVVRVTAGRQLKHVVDPFEFSAEPFLPYAPAILGRLMQLVEEVDLHETKMALLRTIFVIVSKLGRHISLYSDQIMALLSPLWDQAGKEWLMKQSVLTLLIALLDSMEEDSTRYHNVIIPLVASSVDVSSTSRLYLLEDALDLWSALLVHAPSLPSDQMIGLVQHLFPMYESVSETLRKALQITEDYIILIPQQCLAESIRFLTPWTTLLGNVKRDAVGIITSLVELFIREAGEMEGEQAITHLTTNLISTGFLRTLLTGIQTAHSAHQSTGPHRAASSIDGVVETYYLKVLSRLALANSPMLVSALKALYPNDALEETISWLLTEWFSHFDNMAQPDEKKLNCMGLTVLLQLNEPWILNRLQEFMTIWTDTVNELVDPETNEGIDYLVYLDQAILHEPTQKDTLKAQKRRFYHTDPVHQVDIKLFIKEKLQHAVMASGGPEQFQELWVVNVDREVLKGFDALGLI